MSSSWSDAGDETGATEPRSGRYDLEKLNIRIGPTMAPWKAQTDALERVLDDCIAQLSTIQARLTVVEHFLDNRFARFRAVDMSGGVAATGPKTAEEVEQE